MNNTLQHKIAIEYWLEKTERYESSEIAATAIRDQVQDRSFQSFTLPKETSAVLKKICNDKDAGIYVFLLVTLNILVHKYTDAAHVMVASPAPLLAGETATGVPLFLSADIDNSADIKHLLSVLQRELKESYHHKTYSFEKFKEKYPK
jgi:hypothetical protein